MKTPIKKTLKSMIFGALALSASAFAAPDPNFHIYLMFGQSNMEGQGQIASQDRQVPNGLLAMQADSGCSVGGASYGQWRTATPPLIRCYNTAHAFNSGGLGPGDYFGRTMLENSGQGVRVGLVGAAYQGQKIEFFMKNCASMGTCNPTGANGAVPLGRGGYAWLLDLARKAQNDGVIKGIIFHQGESNTGDRSWPGKVNQVVTDLRRDLGLNAAEVPFIAGEMVPGACCTSHNTYVHQISSAVTNGHWVSAAGLGARDQYHFNAAGYREIGRRYAQKMLELIDTSAQGSTSSTAQSSSIASGANSITVRMTGVTGDESVTLSVGGANVATWTLSAYMEDYATATDATGDIRVEFTNDSGDRDVQVDYVIVNGTVRQAEDQEENTGAYDGACGEGSYTEMLHCNGYIGFGPVSGVTPPSSSSAPAPSSSSSSIVVASSSSTTPVQCTEMCKWYQDAPRPLCVNQSSGWGWENNKSCIGRTTCEGQSGTGGVVNSCPSSAAVSSSSVVIPPSSSSAPPSSSSSSSSSSGNCSTVCNWYGSNHPVCANQASGWGWENNKSCIGENTCSIQSGTGGLTQDCSSTVVVSSSSRSSLRSSSSAPRSSSSSSSSSSVQVIEEKLVVAINVGGSDTSLNGVDYQADRYGRGGTANDTSDPISGTAQDTLYQTEKYGSFKYEIPVSDDTYSVSLHFAEIYWEANGERSFNVTVEGDTVLRAIDLYSLAGHDGAYDFDVSDIRVSDGALTIELETIADNATLAGFAVYSETGELDTSVPVGKQFPEFFVGNITTGGNVRSDFARYWDQITPENEGKWGSVEGSRDRYNWAPVDRIYSFARQNGIPVKAHTMVWGSQRPNWIDGLSAADQRAEIEEWIRDYCTRYPDTAMMDVVNEALPSHAPANYARNAFGNNWITESFKLAQKYCPNTILIYNDYNFLTWNTDDIMALIRPAIQAGVVDALGMQAHGLYAPSNRTWTVAELKAKLDKISTLGVPIFISELDIQSTDDQAQLNYMRSVFPMFYTHPNVKGITIWGYVVGSTWRNGTGLIYSDGRFRPAMTWLMDYLKR